MRENKATHPSVPSTVQWEDFWTDKMVKQYVHYSGPQRRWAWSFFAKQHLQGNEAILDIGCTDGQLSADISKLAPQGKVLGIDFSNKMISWARKQYHPSEYPNLSFQRTDLSKLPSENQFDFILAFQILQFSKDPTQDLLAMKKKLKSRGKILATVPSAGNPAFREAITHTKQSEKWKKYWGHPLVRQRFSENEYKSFFEKAGFKIVRIEKIETLDPFVDREEFQGWIRTIVPPVFTNENQYQEFCSDVITQYLKLRPEAINAEGVIYGHFDHLEIEATP